MAMSDDSELLMLRSFYEAWEALHAIPNDRLHRNKAEHAAQALVDAAHALRAFKQPSQIARVLNG
jgi:hypothetical protein